LQWRDSTLCVTFDNFYEPGFKQAAEEWADINDKESIGSNGIFSQKDRRLLWGSYGNYDLHTVRHCYYEDEVKYKKLQKARKMADPTGIFTPNTFSVKRAEESDLEP
jgi:hypothetical protein